MMMIDEFSIKLKDIRLWKLHCSGTEIIAID